MFRTGDGTDVVSDFRVAEGDRIGLAGGARGYTLRSTGAGDAVIVFSGWFVPLAGS